MAAAGRSRIGGPRHGSTTPSPKRALEQLTRIQHHRIRIAQGDPVTGVSTINADQAETFSALGVKKPAASQQLSLLWWSVLKAILRKPVSYAISCRTRAA